MTIVPSLPLGPVVFITGIEKCANGATRVYVGPRYRGRYILPPPEHVEEFERAWAHGGHVWIDPKVLEGEPIFREPDNPAAEESDG